MPLPSGKKDMKGDNWIVALEKENDSRLLSYPTATRIVRKKYS
jgi:hypothetical protein